MSSQKSKEKYIRPSWDEYFMQIADAIAKRATCDRGRSGCVIAKDKQIISGGYVGSAMGDEHCDDGGHLMQKRYNADGTYSEHCVRTVHAEQNAICQAAKRGIAVEGATLYCRMTPCPVCAKMITNCGIKRVVCQKKYHDRSEAERIFSKSGIALVYQSEEEQEYDNKGTANLAGEKNQAQEENFKNQKPTIKIKKLHPLAVKPTYAHDGDAGLDLYSIEDIRINPQSRVKIKTGLAFEVPQNYVGLIWDKSGISTKKGLKTIAGVLDSGYRGELLVCLANITNDYVEIHAGEKIAQMLIQPVEKAQIEEIEELSETQRGEGGFGSTDNDIAQEVGLKPISEDIDELILQKEKMEEEDEPKSRW